MAVEAKQARECLRCLKIWYSSMVYNIESVLERVEAADGGAAARDLVSGCREGSAVGSSLAESLAGLPTFAFTRWSKVYGI